MKSFTFLSILTIALSLTTAVTSAKNIVEIKKEAAAKNLDVLLLYHGSSWHFASRKFLNETWKQSALVNTAKHFAVLKLEVGEDPKSYEAYRKQSHGFKFTPHSFPAIVLLDSKGRHYATIQHNIDGLSAKELSKLIESARSKRKLRDLHWNNAKSKTGLAKAEELGKGIVALGQRTGHGGCYNNIFQEIKKLDPTDKLGYVNYLEYNLSGMWHVTYRISRKKTGWTAEETADARKYLKPFLRNPHFNKQEQQEILAMKFAIDKRSDDLDAAKATLRKMVDLGDQSRMGIGAKGYLEYLTGPVNFRYGWRPHHFANSRKLEWNLDISSMFKGAGIYRLSFHNYWAVARGSITIQSIKVFAGDKEIYSSTPKRNSNYEERVKLPSLSKGAKITLKVKVAGHGGAPAGNIDFTPWFLSE